VRHKLAGEEYNRRREECEEAVRSLGKVLPGIRALRDVSLEQLEEYRGVLSEVRYKRAHHVITENARLLDGMGALRTRSLYQFGECMSESPESLRDKFEVRCAELDLMFELASQQAGVNGAGMTGGGFGGATINLVEASSAEAFAEGVASAYQKKPASSRRITSACQPMAAARLSRTKSPCWVGRP
jgi:galactokinase